MGLGTPGFLEGNGRERRRLPSRVRRPSDRGEAGLGLGASVLWVS